MKYSNSTIIIMSLGYLMQPLHAGVSFDTVRSWFSTTYLEESAQEAFVTAATAITITNKKGSLVVSSWNTNKVMIRSIKKSFRKESAETAVIAIERTTSDAHDALNIASPETDDVSVDFDIIVPKHASITIMQEEGPIEVKNCCGTLDITNQRGDLALYRPTGSVKAHCQNGDVSVKLVDFAPASSLLITTHLGSVTLTAPTNLAAHFSATTKQGMITSDLPITLDALTTKLNKTTYKDMTRSAQGTFNNGTAPITVEVHKGDIYVEEY